MILQEINAHEPAFKPARLYVSLMSVFSSFNLRLIILKVGENMNSEFSSEEIADSGRFSNSVHFLEISSFAEQHYQPPLPF